MTRRVYINGRFLGQHPSGVQRYARNVVLALDALLGDDPSRREGRQYTLLCPPGSPPLEGLAHIAVRHGGTRTGQAWEQLDLPRLTRDGALLSLGNTAPVSKRRQAVAIHDVAVFTMPHAFSANFRRWYRVLLPTLGRVARRVITVSDFSRGELARYAHIPDGKIRVVYNAAEHIAAVAPDPGVFARIGAGDRPFVFAVGNRTPQKNIQVVHEALALLGDAEFDVVHAGEANARVFGDGGAGAEERPSGRGARLVSAGFVSDGELRALYERAACFVFPSVYEGFGLPPLEAMTCGCPVVAARAASIPEVCGDAAVYFDPHDPRDLAAALTRVTADPALRARLARDGRERAKRFSWRASAERVYDVLDEVLGERAPLAPDAAAS